MRRCRATEHENSQALWKLLPLLGERAGVRASVSFDLIFRVEGRFWLEKHFRLVTAAATPLATIREGTLPCEAGPIQEFAQGGAGTARPRVISFCRQGVGDEPSRPPS